DAHTAALTRARQAQEKYSELEQRAVGVETGEEELKTAHEAALVALDEKEVEVAALLEAQREAETGVATWRARREALELALARKDATGALLDGDSPGILGALAGDIHVEGGHEIAIAAALGQWANAAIAESLDTAADALRQSREGDAGIANVIIAGADAPGTPGARGSNFDTQIGRASCRERVRGSLVCGRAGRVCSM